ncbi:hypothetical protein [Leucobacter japonicus]|uniref:hypothetical protein n=1 Tax=Leucobacter japonicus TaxID=1461259 RepID=UPI0006A7CA66|nr:hypothetical protein [Leucobacter japonicus]
MEFETYARRFAAAVVCEGNDSEGYTIEAIAWAPSDFIIVTYLWGAGSRVYGGIFSKREYDENFDARPDAPEAYASIVSTMDIQSPTGPGVAHSFPWESVLQVSNGPVYWCELRWRLPELLPTLLYHRLHDPREWQ